MGKTKYPILFDYWVVRVKGKGLRLFLVVENGLDLASVARKPVFELLRYGEQAFLYAAGRRADAKVLLLATHTRKTLTLGCHEAAQRLCL
jgi:hypothetical protein